MTFRTILSGSLAVFLSGTGMIYAEEPAPPRVLVAPAVQVKEAAPGRHVGALESIKHVDIVPRVTGNLLRINFTEGNLVRKGDLLYELEDTTYLAAVDSLIAQKEALEASLRFATREYKRNESLIRSNAVSHSAYDKAVLEIDAARANIKKIEASLTDARNTLSYTRIYAPLDGRIGKSAYTEGNLLTPSTGKLTDIEMLSPIYVRFSLSERVFRRDFGGSEGIRKNAVVRVQLADGSIYNEAAKVTLIDNKINVSTNTITLWATFENKDHKLIPGGFVTVLLSVRTAKPYVAVLPSALIAESDGYSVYVLDAGNKVIRKPIKTGNVADGLQIVLSGLDGSERVIVDGTHKVKPGMTVTPVAFEKGK